MDYSIVRRWKGPLGKRIRIEAVAIAVVLFAAVTVFTAMRQVRRKPGLHWSGGCHIRAIFNFGDSNSDTGSLSAAFGRLLPPNGQSFFGKPSGRYSDGRLIIDFIAEKLGMPYLNAYLDSMGANFRHGANFAAGGSIIRPIPFINPLHLNIQLSQFEQFKARTIELHNQAKNSYASISLPRPEDFSEALFTIDTGQNDLHNGLASTTPEQTQKSIPSIIDHFASALEKLYQQGARKFWIHNTGPIGCLPIFLINFPPKPGETDQEGCYKAHNEVAQEFNNQLKDMVSQLRTKFQDALLIYVDIYSAKYSLIREAKQHGFVDPLGYCCGHNYGKYSLSCGEKVVVNGTEFYGGPCTNPSKYISWDNIHYTEAANQWVANRILDGSLSDPHIPITQACDHNFARSQ